MILVSINQSNLTNSLSTNLNSNINEMDDQLYLIGNSIDLMINAICFCLQDSNSLVQRNMSLNIYNRCKHNSKCVETKNGYRYECDNNYEGEKKIDKCRKVNCKPGKLIFILKYIKISHLY